MKDEETEAGQLFERLDVRGFIKFSRQNPSFLRGLSTDVNEYFSKLTALKDECKVFGIVPKLIDDSCDGACGDEFDSIGMDIACNELSLQLLEHIVCREDRNVAGETHLVGRKMVMPDSLINELALTMLETCTEESLSAPFSLVVLLRTQLGRLGGPHFHPEEPKARKLATLLYASDSNLSTREVGEAVGVAHTTVARWLKNTTFQQAVKDIGSVKNVAVFLKRLVQKSPSRVIPPILEGHISRIV